MNNNFLFDASAPNAFDKILEYFFLFIKIRFFFFFNYVILIPMWIIMDNINPVKLFLLIVLFFLLFIIFSCFPFVLFSYCLKKKKFRIDCNCFLQCFDILFKFAHRGIIYNLNVLQLFLKYILLLLEILMSRTKLIR